MKTLTLPFICSLIFYNANTFAQPGSLDSSFGINGIVTTAVGDYIDGGYSVAIQPDGKILVTGSSDNGVMGQFALVRYNNDGSADIAFGTNGKVITPIGGTSGYGYGAKSLAIQQDGKIVTAGISIVSSLEKFTLVRYHPDGSPDSSFGLNGIVTTDMGSWCGIFSITIQPDGKIVAAGYSYPGGLRFALARYNDDGTLDTSFGDGGNVITAFGIGDVEAFSVALQPDGKIVVSGYADTNWSADIALVRYNSDGAPDSSFGTNGIVMTDYGYGYSVLIQEDDMVLVGGFSQGKFAVVRYNPDGSPDPSFGTGGMTTTAIGETNDEGFSLALQADGKIILVGYSYSAPDSVKWALVRYHPNGSLDQSFGSGGVVTTAIALTAFANDVAVQPDGKIVVAGTSDVYFAVARYNADFPTEAIVLSTIKNSLSIFPNPSSDKITVSFSSNEKGELHITSTLGQVIFSENINADKEKIDVSQFPKGMYLVTVITSSQKLESKFLKQ